MYWFFDNMLWERFAAWASAHLGLGPIALANLSQTVLVILAYIGVRPPLKRWVLRYIDDRDRRYRISRAFNYGWGVLSTVVLAKIWLLGRVSLTTYLGFLSAGLAISLRDPISNFAGWLFVMWRKPFKLGDRVELGEHRGDIVDIRMFMFTMLEVGNWVDADQSTGRIVHVPNGHIFTRSCANYTQGFEYIWNEIPIVITFESDWARAHALLEGILKDVTAEDSQRAMGQIDQVSEHYRISFRHLTPIVWIDVVDIGVRLTLRYLCLARGRRSSADRVWRAVLSAFAGDDRIDFAYPTQRFYDHRYEGKQPISGPQIADNREVSR